VFGSHWRGGGGVVGLPCQPDGGGAGGGGGGGGGAAGCGGGGGGGGGAAGCGGGGVAGVPCHAEGGGGGAGGGGAGGGGGADIEGGAFSTFVPETQQVCGTGAGTALFSEQRAYGPCTPGFTNVNATQGASFMQADWHISGLPSGSSKLR